MSSHSFPPHRDVPDACAMCARRDFLRTTAGAIAGAMLAIGVPRRRAAALPITIVRALRREGGTVTYPLPAADGVSIDRDNQDILVRWQNVAYAFNLACPHQNTALEWDDADRRFQCPKHHSKYQPDGTFISGRATRAMDRLGIQLQGANLVVDLDAFYRQDKNPDQWTAAFVRVS
jgi:Rieske Fe-S protein